MIFFKAEANSKIGGGHLYRCLSIAKECSKKGGECGFIFAESPDSSVQKVVDAGYKVHIIEKIIQFDIRAYLKFIPVGSIVVFDTDDYRFYSGNLVDSFRREKIHTACFSITDRFPITTDILINPNIISKKHEYKVGNNTKKYLGPEYLIMNESFRKLKICFEPKEIKYPATLLLIFGNADVCQLTIYFLSLISLLSGFINKAIVVVGRLNPDIEEIKQQVSNIKEIDIELHIDTKEIIKLYEQCDFSITSAGMAMWEMAIFSIHQLVIASTPRELEYTNYLSELGYVKKIGDFSNLPSIKEMGKKLREYFLHKQYLDIKIHEFSKLINPNGIHLIVEHLINYELSNNK